MNHNIFLYPGQGSQSIGMGVSAVESFSGAEKVFRRASELAGYDMLELCSEGPMEKLSRTLYTQPALYTVEAALTEALKAKGIEPAATAGHSLGEFSAWYAAGVYSFDEGFGIVSERGRLMDNADPDGIGTMAAVIGLAPEDVRDVCAGVEGQVVVANYNSPLQQVISGEKTAVEKACEILSEKGARRVVPLKVSGAFHSTLMEKAQERFAEIVQSIEISDADVPVYANVTAAPVTDAGDIRGIMVEQLTSSVRWTESFQAIVRDVQSRCGKEEEIKLYEVGPGNVLAGLAKRIDKSLPVISAEDMDWIEEA